MKPPKDLSPEQTAAWKLFGEAGASLSKVAEATGVPRSTIGTWRTKWINEHGADAFDASVRAPDAEPEWSDNRTRAGLRFGAAAEVLTRRIAELGATVGSAGSTITATELRDLAETAQLLVDQAERLDGPRSDVPRLGVIVGDVDNEGAIQSTRYGRRIG